MEMIYSKPNHFSGFRNEMKEVLIRIEPKLRSYRDLENHFIELLTPPKVNIFLKNELKFVQRTAVS